MTHVPILLTVSTKYLVTFVFVSLHEQSTCSATTFTFTNGFSLYSTVFVVGETFPTPKMSVTFVAGDANVREHTRRARHTVAASLVTDVCYITPTTFMTCITYVLFRHCTSKVIT